MQRANTRVGLASAGINRGIMISIVTTYKNRREHIEKVLPTWLKQTKSEFEIIITDYESDDDITGLLKKHKTEGVTIRHVRCTNLPKFNLSHARNIGASYAQGDILFFVDVDTALPPNATSFISDNICSDLYLAAVDSKIQKEIINGGLIAVYATEHMSICGFNESLKGWGFEDIDYKQRLENSGLHFYKISNKIYHCIDHPDDERTRCYEDKKDVSWDKNRQAALKLWKPSQFGKWDFITIY